MIRIAQGVFPDDGKKKTSSPLEDATVPVKKT